MDRDLEELERMEKEFGRYKAEDDDLEGFESEDDEELEGSEGEIDEVLGWLDREIESWETKHKELNRKVGGYGKNEERLGSKGKSGGKSGYSERCGKEGSCKKEESRFEIDTKGLLDGCLMMVVGLAMLGLIMFWVCGGFEGTSTESYSSGSVYDDSYIRQNSVTSRGRDKTNTGAEDTSDGYIFKRKITLYRNGSAYTFDLYNNSGTKYILYGGIYWKYSNGKAIISGNTYTDEND